MQEMVESEEASPWRLGDHRQGAIFARHEQRRRDAGRPYAPRSGIERGNIVVVFPDRAEKYLSTTMFDEFAD